MEHDAAVKLALTGRVFGDIGDPQLVRAVPAEVAFDQVGDRCPSWAAMLPGMAISLSVQGVQAQDSDAETMNTGHSQWFWWQWNPSVDGLICLLRTWTCRRCLARSVQPALLHHTLALPITHP